MRLSPILLPAILSTFLLQAFAQAQVLTVYRDAKFSFQQEVSLPAGPEAVFSGLPPNVDPFSILLSPGSPGLRLVSWEFLEERNEAPADPLSRLTNRQIDIVDSADHAFKGRVLRWYPDSLLLAQEGSGQSFIIFRKDIKAVHLQPSSVSALTDKSLSRPAGLRLRLDPPTGGTLRLFYQAEGISCVPLYRIFIDEKAGRLDFLGEFYLENGTGIDYADAAIEYLEGEMMTAGRPRPGLGDLKLLSMNQSSSAPEEEVERADLFEYTRYQVKAAGGLRAFSKRHVTHFSLAAIPYRKSFYFNPSMGPGRGSVLAKISFTNSKANGLGFDLPGGEAKVYSGENGTVRLIGENELERTTPSDEIRLFPGSTRDITVRREPTAQKRVTERTLEQTVQLTVKNDKDTPVSVELEEPMAGVWEIKSASDRYVRNGIRSVSFTVEVAAKSERVVSYTFWQR